MNSEDTTVALLERALAQAETVLAGIRPGQESLPTPCADWNVNALVIHLAKADLPNFKAAARGESVDWARPPGELGGDWLEEFRSNAQALQDIWTRADLDQQVPSMGGRTAPLRSRADQQIAELAMHSWDLARATGQHPDLDSEVAEHGLAWSRTMLRPEFRGPDKAFGAEFPVPSGASSYDRLAGWFGRDPLWSPEGSGPAGS
jgi:uncharacterized protein (TIGR03086 family)